jgi:hypothetical protein
MSPTQRPYELGEGSKTGNLLTMFLTGPLMAFCLASGNTDPSIQQLVDLQVRPLRWHLAQVRLGAASTLCADCLPCQVPCCQRKSMLVAVDICMLSSCRGFDRPASPTTCLTYHALLPCCSSVAVSQSTMNSVMGEWSALVLRAFQAPGSAKSPWSVVFR